MSEKMKRMGPLGWAVVAFALLPMLYVVSFGPACRLSEHEFIEPRACWHAYRPITKLMVDGPPALAEPLWRYAMVCGEYSVIDFDLGRFAYSRSRSPIDMERDAGQPALS